MFTDNFKRAWGHNSLFSARFPYVMCKGSWDDQKLLLLINVVCLLHSNHMPTNSYNLSTTKISMHAILHICISAESGHRFFLIHSNTQNFLVDPPKVGCGTPPFICPRMYGFMFLSNRLSPEWTTDGRTPSRWHLPSMSTWPGYCDLHYITEWCYQCDLLQWEAVCVCGLPCVWWGLPA